MPAVVVSQSILETSPYGGMARFSFFAWMGSIFLFHVAIKGYYGGIGRIFYFLGGLVISPVYTLITGGDPLYAPKIDPSTTLILGIMSVVFMVIIVMSRVRNIGMNPWWSFLILIPFIGHFIGFICLIRQPGYAEIRKLDFAGKFIACIIGAIAILFATFVIINQMM